MNVETAIKPGRTNPADLVPSRYALDVGDLEVLIISDGVLPLPAQTMSTNVTPEARDTWFNERFLNPEMFDWALNILVVRNGDRTILIDAGLGGQFDGFPRAGRFPKRLEAAGIPLNSITDVIITHMHMDHIGGLLVQDVRNGLRPDVRIHVNAAEVEFWKNPDFSRTDMPAPVPEVLRSTAAEFVEAYRDKIRTFENEQEVAPGVTAKRTGGHTPGHSVVRVESNGERLLFAGDALFPVGLDHPDWHNGFEHDPDEAVRVRIHLLQDAAENGELVVATHMPFPSLGRIAVDDNAFRWVPSIWDY